MIDELSWRILVYVSSLQREVDAHEIARYLQADVNSVRQRLLSLHEEKLMLRISKEQDKWKVPVAGKILIGSKKGNKSQTMFSQNHSQEQGQPAGGSAPSSGMTHSAWNGNVPFGFSSPEVTSQSVSNLPSSRPSALPREWLTKLPVPQNAEEEKIMALMSSCQSMTTSQIMKSIQLDKRSLNRILYSMQKRGLLNRAQQSPPLWEVSTRALKSHSGHYNLHQKSDAELKYSAEQNSAVESQQKLGSTSSLPQKNPFDWSEPPLSPKLLLQSDPRFMFSSQQRAKEVPIKAEGAGIGLAPGSHRKNVRKICSEDKGMVLACSSAGTSFSSAKEGSCSYGVNDMDGDMMVLPSTAHIKSESISDSDLAPLSYQLDKALSVPRTHAVNTLFKPIQPQASISSSKSQTGLGPPTPADLLGLTAAQKEALITASKPHSLQSGCGRADGPLVMSNVSTSLSNDAFAALNKNSVSALTEYAQARKQSVSFEVLKQTGPPHNPRFTIAVILGGRQFPAVQCSNKKEGRKEAADAALRILMAEGAYQHTTTPSIVSLVDAGKGTHFDQIAAIAHNTYNQVVVHIAENMAGRKVLAALVMKRGPDDLGSVISLGTGNRTITGQFLSLEGQTVNDSHAEIITRRGFMRYLYKQLLQNEPGASASILELCPNGKYRIKQGITFHLYISTAPCGDGALFSPRDSHQVKMACDYGDQTHQPVFSTKLQGLLRTKVEGGEGTIPIEPDLKPQTWDGILRGERLRTMSCSDKVCSWNLLGLQGALLSHFLEPVYLDSITLGFLYDHGHLSRAVCCRLSHGTPDVAALLPQEYRINHPKLGRVTICDPPREVQKTKEFSINWIEGDAKPEVLDGTKGICTGVSSLDAQISRISKSALYRQFKEVCKKHGQSSLLASETYAAAKLAAQDFQTTKKLMLAKFVSMGYGRWVSKPPEEGMFDV